MQSDYLWVRNAPVEEGLKIRYDKVDAGTTASTTCTIGPPTPPNDLNRSTGKLVANDRSMGKQYDWELEKFRLSKKPTDRGNKRRGFKNFFRLVKNPLGYIGWKTHRWMNPLPKMVTLGAFLYWSTVVYYWKGISNDHAEVDRMLVNYGKNVEGTSGRMKGYHNRKTFHTPNFPEGMMRTHFFPELVTLNPTWRQNIRKELQLTNNYNVQF